MGKKNRRRKQRRQQQRSNGEKATAFPDSGLAWMDGGDVHALFPGKQPPPEFLDLLTENFQLELRNSPLWDQMVSKFGEEEAKKLLKQCPARFGG